MNEQKGNETQQAVDVLAVLDDAFAELRAMDGHGSGSLSVAADRLDQARAAVAELIEAARNASAILGHAYHTQITGQLADEAHDAYQRLDSAIASMGSAP